MVLKKEWLFLVFVMLVIVVQASADPNADATLAPLAQCPGDFDDNGIVNVADFLLFVGVFGISSGDANYNALMDMNGDEEIGIPDFLLFVDVFGTTCEQTVISIPDANLRAVIEDSLGKAKGAPITQTEMASLTRLEAPNSNISDLTGLEHATNLTELNFGEDHDYVNSNSISDLSPLSGLTNLTRLILNRANNISDVFPLSGLTNLTVLQLNYNNIIDVSPLSELTNLTRLDLYGNNIANLSPLSGLINLEELQLGANNITDVSPLSGLINLEELALSANNITDVSPLSGLSNLKELHLPETRVTDVSPLSKLTNLEELYLWNIGITNVPPLSGLTNLKNLDLRFNQIKDVSSLSGLTNLVVLNLFSNNISDISPLSNLTNLEVLRLDQNSISNIAPLSNLTNLIFLGLGINSIGDVSALSGLTKLLDLFLDKNNITDVSALSGLTSLRRLHLQNNNITDLAPLVANTGLGSRDEVDVKGNLLSATSINMHVPALEARGVSVSFDETIIFTNPQIYNDNVFVLPVTEDLAAGNLPLDKYATRIYGHFSDAFDFLIFFPSLNRDQLDSGAFRGAYYASVGNDVQGIGVDLYFNDAWGSAGKLQGGLFFAHVSVSGWEHSRLVRGPMLHELMHRWANFIVEPAVPHWDFTSADGILGGFDIANLMDHGGGRYSAPDVYTGGWAANLKPYSPIELYLAGLISPDEVPDLWVGEDGEIVKFGYGGAPDDFTASRVKIYTIEDIVAEHGARVPDHTQSQKAFRAAVILLVSEDYPAVRRSLEMLSNDATLFSHAGEDQFDDWYNFFEATGGRATISMDGLSQFKNSGATKRIAVRSFGTPPPPIVCHWH